MELSFDSKFKKNIKTVVVICATATMILFIVFVTMLAWSENFIIGIIQGHFAAIIGLPFVALLSFSIVGILELSFGAIEFEGLGFKFKGASGPIILWVLCFLVVSMAIKILW